VISGFRCDVEQICALLGYYTASSGSSVPTFRDNLSVPPSRIKKSKLGLLNMGRMGYLETSVQNYLSTLRDMPDECKSGGDVTNLAVQDLSNSCHLFFISVC
jgi:hypothetical protein